MSDAVTYRVFKLPESLLAAMWEKRNESMPLPNVGINEIVTSEHAPVEDVPSVVCRS